MSDLHPTSSNIQWEQSFSNNSTTSPYFVYALLAYAKTAKTDMTPDERRTVSKLAAALKAARKRR